jgi:hypothetical protein
MKPININWNAVPPWIDWVTCDMDGIVTGWSNEPKIETMPPYPTEWANFHCTDGEGECCNIPQEYAAFAKDLPLERRIQKRPETHPEVARVICNLRLTRALNALGTAADAFLDIAGNIGFEAPSTTRERCAKAHENAIQVAKDLGDPKEGA